MNQETSKRNPMPVLLAVLSLIVICALIWMGSRRSSLNRPDHISVSEFLLDTFITITIYDSDDTSILDHCVTICKDYETLLSKTSETGEVYRINHRGAGEQTFELSDATAFLVRKALSYSELSDGAFDVTIEPVSSLWDFRGDNPVVPPEDEIRAAREKTGYQNILMDGNTITFLSPDTTIDLGGIAKGFIADEIKEYLKSEGIESALIDLGGDTLCIGNRKKGTPFRIGLKKPFGSVTETFAVASVTDLSVVASGTYERYFEQDGKLYHHILDPSTGYPYDNGLVSVSVIAEKSVDGDALSTTLFSLGLEKGLELASSLEDVYAVFVDEDGKIYYSEGASDFIKEN